MYACVYACMHACTHACEHARTVAGRAGCDVVRGRRVRLRDAVAVLVRRRAGEPDSVNLPRDGMSTHPCMHVCVCVCARAYASSDRWV